MGGFQEKFPKIEEKQRRRKRVIREWRWRDAGVFWDQDWADEWGIGRLDDPRLIWIKE